MKIIAFDIETADAELMHRWNASTGPFVKLCGWTDVNDPAGTVHLSTDPRALLDVLLAADVITGHNIINFDLMALAVHTEDRYEELCRKAQDTILAERHLDPVGARGAQPTGFYGLDQTAGRYGVGGKSTVDFEGKREILRRIKGDKYADRMKPGKTTEFSVLKVLADAYGGFGAIDPEDPDYREYLRRDVLASKGVYLAQRDALSRHTPASRSYLRHEHATGAHMGRVTIEGCRVDTDLNFERLSAGQARLDAAKQRLHDQHGMPLEGKKPHTTNPGKAAFRAALLATGINEDHLDEHWPLNADGSLSTAKDTLTQMTEVLRGAGNETAAVLCETIKSMNGERTIYQTIDTWTGPDGRVHPYIGPDQASGRWSMKDPGLTVFGKRGGKAAERAVILADNDDEVLVAIDADQVDARAVAALSQDPEYLKLFGTGVDLHSEVAFRVWANMAQHSGGCHDSARPGCDCGVIRKCHCVLRDRAKVFGHGWNYGMGAATMVRQHGVEFEVANEFCQGMQRGFPVLVAWQNANRQAAGVLGFDETPPADDTWRTLYTGFGRPLRCDRTRAYTQATALIGQGTTRDIMARSIAKLPPHIRRRVRAVIHDEIVISLPKVSADGTDAQTLAQRIADGMAFDFDGGHEDGHSVRITFGCSRVARSWAGCYGAEYETAA